MERVEDYMYDWLWQIQWIEVWALLTSGHPSLIQQLLVINTALVVLMIILRIRRKPNPRQRTHFFLQELLLLVNVIVLSEDQFVPFFQTRIEPIIYRFNHWVL